MLAAERIFFFMPKSSAAYVTCVAGGKTYTWHFTEVTGIEHNLALNLTE